MENEGNRGVDWITKGVSRLALRLGALSLYSDGAFAYQREIYALFALIPTAKVRSLLTRVYTANPYSMAERFDSLVANETKLSAQLAEFPAKHR